MATNKGGRPRKHAKGMGTNQVRVDEDLAQMIGWICEAKGVSTASLISPLLREKVEDMYKELYPMIQKIKDMQDELDKLKGQEPGPELPDLEIFLDDGERSSLHEVYLPPSDLPANFFGAGNKPKKTKPKK